MEGKSKKKKISLSCHKIKKPELGVRSTCINGLLDYKYQY